MPWALEFSSSAPLKTSSRMSHLSKKDQAAIAEIERAARFRQRRLNRPAPRPSNTPDYWRYLNATMSARAIVDEIDPNCVAEIVLTTNTANAKKVQKSISRIIERRLKPHCSGHVRFFDRTEDKKLVHYHIIAAMKWPVLAPPFLSSEERILMRELEELTHHCASARGEKSGEAKQLMRQLAAALASAGLGYIVKMDVIDNIERHIEYAAKYLKGVAALGRTPEDRDIQLYSAGGIARRGHKRPHFLVQGERLARLKLAAFAASHGAASMAEARKLIGPKWAYHAREKTRVYKLREYPREEDFRNDWGSFWTPEALGIRIKDPMYSPTNRGHSYRWEQVLGEHHDLIASKLQFTWSLPDWVWPGKDV